MTMLAPPAPARFTDAEFERLVAAGAVGDMRLELRGGVIVRMSPQHYPHARLKRVLADALKAAIAEAALGWLVEQELSVRFGAGFQPLPDIVVWDPAQLAAAPSGPMPGQAVRLIVEAADASLADDLGAKAADYARAGLGEYWVGDVQAQLVHLHAGPSATGYGRRVAARLGERFSALTLPLELQTTA